MNNATDNFDALWSNLKSEVAKARTKREMILTRDDLPRLDRLVFSGQVSVSKGDEDGTHIHFYQNSWSGMMSVNANDLRTIAAHCLAAAEEIEEALVEAQAVRPLLSAQRA